MNKFLLMLLAGFLTLSSIGCSTVEGFGKDVQSAGSAIEEEAEENK